MAAYDETKGKPENAVSVEELYGPAAGMDFIPSINIFGDGRPKQRPVAHEDGFRMVPVENIFGDVWPKPMFEVHEDAVSDIPIMEPKVPVENIFESKSTSRITMSGLPGIPTGWRSSSRAMYNAVDGLGLADTMRPDGSKENAAKFTFSAISEAGEFYNNSLMKFLEKYEKNGYPGGLNADGTRDKATAFPSLAEMGISIVRVPYESMPLSDAYAGIALVCTDGSEEVSDIRKEGLEKLSKTFVSELHRDSARVFLQGTEAGRILQMTGLTLGEANVEGLGGTMIVPGLSVSTVPWDGVYDVSKRTLQERADAHAEKPKIKRGTFSVSETAPEGPSAREEIDKQLSDWGVKVIRDDLANRGLSPAYSYGRQPVSFGDPFAEPQESVMAVEHAEGKESGADEVQQVEDRSVPDSKNIVDEPSVRYDKPVAIRMSMRDFENTLQGRENGANNVKMNLALPLYDGREHKSDGYQSVRMSFDLHDVANMSDGMKVALGLRDLIPSEIKGNTSGGSAVDIYSPELDKIPAPLASRVALFTTDAIVAMDLTAVAARERAVRESRIQGYGNREMNVSTGAGQIHRGEERLLVDMRAANQAYGVPGLCEESLKQNLAGMCACSAVMGLNTDMNQDAMSSVAKIYNDTFKDMAFFHEKCGSLGSTLDDDNGNVALDSNHQPIVVRGTEFCSLAEMGIKPVEMTHGIALVCVDDGPEAKANREGPKGLAAFNKAFGTALYNRSVSENLIGGPNAELTSSLLSRLSVDLHQVTDEESGMVMLQPTTVLQAAPEATALSKSMNCALGNHKGQEEDVIGKDVLDNARSIGDSFQDDETKLKVTGRVRHISRKEGALDDIYTELKKNGLEPVVVDGKGGHGGDGHGDDGHGVV